MKTSTWIFGVSLFVGMVAAEACGPDFPLMLTTCRVECLNQVTTPGFAYYAIRVLPADPAYPTPSVEQLAQSQYSHGFMAWQLESEDTEEGATRTIRSMRAAENGEAAYAMGDGLSEAKRLYTAGAVDFHRAHNSGSYQPSGGTVDEVGPLIDPDTGLTAAIGWFEKVLALPPADAEPRLLWATYMLGRCHLLRNRDVDETSGAAYLMKTVELSRATNNDAMGLGAAALGELGRLSLEHKRYRDAVSYYLQQTREAESESAIQSLWLTAQQMPDDKDLLVQELKDPVMQKFLLAYAIADNLHRGPQVPTIVDVLSHMNPKSIQWPDVAAAIAYRENRLDEAERLLGVTDSPYAEWIRAKVELHRGNYEAAARAFALASKGFDTIDNVSQQSMPERLPARMHGELALFLLSRKDYVEALYQLSVVKGYEDDGRYVAERVLTIDELRAVVDTQFWAANYRDILARRMARSKRADEAVDYYDDAKTKAAASEYATRWRQLSLAKSNLARAQELYELSKLEINSGMELIASERCPDFAEYNGSFSSWCSDPDKMDETSDGKASADEISRVASSAVLPNVTWHYRSVGVDHLLDAADLLPRHSLVLSSALCNGVSWLHQHGRSYNEDLVQTLYRRYLKDGRPGPWADKFGNACPAPIFSAT